VAESRAGAQRWPGDLLILPAHYGSDLERRADRTVAAAVRRAGRHQRGAAIQDERTFPQMDRGPHARIPRELPHDQDREFGLVDVSDADAEILEVGANQCAIG